MFKLFNSYTFLVELGLNYMIFISCETKFDLFVLADMFTIYASSHIMLVTLIIGQFTHWCMEAIDETSWYLRLRYTVQHPTFSITTTSSHTLSTITTALFTQPPQPNNRPTNCDYFPWNQQNLKIRHQTINIVYPFFR